MKKVMRIGLFETNSSSSNTLVVFDNNDAYVKWEFDSQAYLDLREAQWIDWDPDDEDEVNDLVFVASFEDFVQEGDDIYNDIIANMEPDEDGDYTSELVLNHILPHPSRFYGYWPTMLYEHGVELSDWQTRVMTDAEDRYIHNITVRN